MFLVLFDKYIEC